MSAEVARVLQTAANLLESRGWVPHLGPGGDGPCCIVEALTLAAVPKEDTYFDVYEVVRSHLGVSSLTVWNDDQTHAGPVLAALRTAADEAEAL